MSSFLSKLSGYRPHSIFVLANAGFAALFITLLLSAFHSPRPHDLPIGIVAPAQQTQQVRQQLDAHLSGGFDLTSFPTAAAADSAIKHRDIDAALVIAPQGLQLRTAGASGSALTSAVTQVFTQVATTTGKPLTVVDVVPPGSGDTQALTSFFIVLGVLFPSLAAGAGSALLFRRSRRVWCLGALVVVAVAAGLVAAAVADGMASIGHYWSVAAIIALFSLAISAPTAAFGRLKAPLVSLGVLIFMVFGLPVSGGPSGLASFGYGYLREFDDWLPLGVAASSVRNTVYFDGNDTTNHLWVLGAWAAAGLVAITLLTTLGRRSTLTPAQAARTEIELEEFAPVDAAIFDRAVEVAAAEKAAGKIADKPPVRDVRTELPAGRATELVVGFDNSETSYRALRWAVDLLSSRPGALVVVYVGDAHGETDETGSESGDAHNKQAAAVALAAVGDIADSSTLTWSFEHRRGATAEVILSTAAEHAQAPAAGETETLIVVGRSSGGGRHEVGSVPVRLLEQSPYPVIVIS